MNRRNQNIILLVLVAIITIVPMIIYSGLGEDEGYFGAASEVIEETDYEPWFSSFWEPPSW